MKEGSLNEETGGIRRCQLLPPPTPIQGGWRPEEVEGNTTLGQTRSRMETVWTQQGSREEWSYRRALLRWGLISTLLLSLILIFSVLLFYTFHSCGPRPCKSPVCLELVASYLTMGNASALPCTDFYSFVCGNLTWASESRDMLQVLKEKNQNQLRRILEASVPWPPDSAEEKTVRFYKACMDTDAIDASGAEPLMQVIEELGGWHISGNRTLPDFNHTLKLLMSQYGNFPFFKAYLRPQPSPPHVPVIQIDQPEFQIPFRPVQKNYPEILRAYLSYLQQLGTLLGGDQKVVLEHASISMTITSNLLLASKSPDQRKREGKLFQETTIAQLQEVAPSIDWLPCLRAIFSPMILSPSQPIIVHDLEYIRGMSNVIGQMPKDGYRDYLQSHMILGLVSTLVPALDSHFQNAQRNLSQKLQELAGQSPITFNIPRWKKCIEETGAFFEPTLGAMFVQKTFSHGSRDAATQLFSEIKNALSRHLKRIRWMDEGSKREVQTKLSQLKVEMGAPAEVLKPGATTQDYEDISFGPSFLQTFLSCSRALRERTVRGFLEPPSRRSWKISPWEVNAYYSMSDNVAVFPAGLLQPPFFCSDYPSAVNFGAAGSVMAHELMHIFNQYCGHTYQDFPILTTVVPGGCPACDIPTLYEEQLCLRQHYESFSLPAGSTFNSSHTLLENAADIGALLIAMKAYRKWQQKHKGETILPRLGLSPYQLFYQSYAQACCPLHFDLDDFFLPGCVWQSQPSACSRPSQPSYSSSPWAP
ncbi:kell blood group glycoprotein isoform X3 [Phascolarctos cinereus]|uniref:Kell blood group glycoprotein isoform X3 n=1 Tax=Phascolarctos cinereus TaxID=38626 RepID=A0A6P5L6H6_PHACI|nr:kell blood group glycoprotein isoform X3 [Phascolarctos cinereus]